MVEHSPHDGCMSRQLRILSGLHQGAAVTLEHEERCLIGSDAQCSVVLLDRQVAPRHCVVQIDDFGLTCRAIDAPVLLGERQLAASEVAKIEDFTLIRCGEAALAVGPPQGDWTIAERAVQARTITPLHTLRALRQLNPYTLFAMVSLAITCVIGVAYAALMDRSSALTADRVAAARSWLKRAASPGSELTIGADTVSSHELILTGYVRRERELQTLLAASRASGFAPRVEVYSVDEMRSSIERLSRLAQVPCELQYQGSGRFSCSDPVSGDAAATKLRVLAHEVPGVRALQVTVVRPHIVAGRRKPPPRDTEPVRLTRKFSVFMFRNERFLIGPFGERYKEGDQFDGFTIRRIGLDKVLLERDSRDYEFYVAALSAR